MFICGQCSAGNSTLDREKAESVAVFHLTNPPKQLRHAEPEPTFDKQYAKQANPLAEEAMPQAVGKLLLLQILISYSKGSCRMQFCLTLSSMMNRRFLLMRSSGDLFKSPSSISCVALFNVT
ncbi:hypothetical protein BpHYR1_016126 [Brachionus plicatilis]|uniref:Uncharacterized protein n=1 Tax=Brachionus plicatilis TaxID=10195 RepID=A0A3M7QQR1_BRAPC|nr:hypothetical protein BpHYR1_016126 [Brachionus plicatilis]